LNQWGKKAELRRLGRAEPSQYPFTAGETLLVSILASPAYRQKHMTELNQMDELPPSTGGIPA